jgi:hypothetical protein
MTYRLKILLAILILTVTTVSGQNFEPLELAKKIFGNDKFPNLERFIMGEYDGHPNGQDLQAGSKIHFMVLGQTADKAVVSMTILDSTSKGLDTYLHFQKDTIWKLTAFRALAMTGMIEGAKNELEKMTMQQVDELIEKSKKSKNDYSVFSSREDYYFELGNARLILELDDNIIKHFLNNKAEFERIKEMAIHELDGKKTDGERSIKLAESLRNDYKKLFIKSVSYGDYELGGKCFDFSIGGMLDNTVGYLYVKDKKDLPEMTDRRVIMIREISDGWYIYKTT